MTPREAVERSVVGFEGGDANDPEDYGGPTRFGLTWTVFLEERPHATREEFQALTRDQVIDLLTNWAVLRRGIWRIGDQWVLWAMTDFAIHSHPITAIKELQRILGGLVVDGVFGRQTERAVSLANPEQLFRRLTARRVRYLAQIIHRDRTQAKFARAWFDRVAAILETP